MVALVEEAGLGFEEQISAITIYIIGVVALFWGSLQITACYGLWKLKKWGAYVALVLSCLVIILSIIQWNFVSSIDIVLGVIIIILIAVSWKRLSQYDTTVSNQNQ